MCLKVCYSHLQDSDCLDRVNHNIKQKPISSVSHYSAVYAVRFIGNKKACLKIIFFTFIKHSASLLECKEKEGNTLKVKGFFAVVM